MTKKTNKTSNNLLMAALLVLLAVGLYLHSETMISNFEDQKVLGSWTSTGEVKMERLDKELEKEVKALEVYTKSKFGEFTTEFLSEKELGM